MKSRAKATSYMLAAKPWKTKKTRSLRALRTAVSKSWRGASAIAEIRAQRER